MKRPEAPMKRPPRGRGCTPITNCLSRRRTGSRWLEHKLNTYTKLALRKGQGRQLAGARKTRHCKRREPAAGRAAGERWRSRDGGSRSCSGTRTRARQSC